MSRWLAPRAFVGVMVGLVLLVAAPLFAQPPRPMYPQITVGPVIGAFGGLEYRTFNWKGLPLGCDFTLYGQPPGQPSTLLVTIPGSDVTDVSSQMFGEWAVPLPAGIELEFLIWNAQGACDVTQLMGVVPPGPFPKTVLMASGPGHILQPTIQAVARQLTQTLNITGLPPNAPSVLWLGGVPKEDFSPDHTGHGYLVHGSHDPLPQFPRQIRLDVNGNSLIGTELSGPYPHVVNLSPSGQVVLDEPLLGTTEDFFGVGFRNNCTGVVKAILENSALSTLGTVTTDNFGSWSTTASTALGGFDATTFTFSGTGSCAGEFLVGVNSDDPARRLIKLSDPSDTTPPVTAGSQSPGPPGVDTLSLYATDAGHGVKALVVTATGDHSLHLIVEGDSYVTQLSAPGETTVTYYAVDHAGNFEAPQAIVLTGPKLTPEITWNPPMPIAVGTPLGAGQLNASSAVVGNYSYSPPAGTILPLGNAQPLSVTFTPLNTSVYNTVTMTVFIDVVAQIVPRIVIDPPVTFVTQVIRGAGFPAGSMCEIRIASGWLTQAGIPISPTGAWGLNFLQPPGLPLFPRDVTFDCGAAGVFTGSQTQPTGVVAMAPFGTLTFDPIVGNANAGIRGVGFPPSCSFVLSASNAGTNIGVGSGFTAPDGTFNFNFNFSVAAQNAQQYSFAGMQGCSTTALGGLNPGGGYPRTIDLSPLPVVTWPPVASMTFGTPLGAAQLNATANMPGTFVYNPPAGTVLAGGLRPLTVAFFPTDPAFLSVIKTNVVNVLGAGGFSGTVVSAATGAPIANATVTAHDLNGNQVASAVTNATGQYFTPSVAVGQYYAKAHADGHVDEVFSEITCLAGCDVRTGTRISVPSGPFVPGVNFTLSVATADIAGAITDAFNQPIGGVRVEVFNAGGSLVQTVTSNPAGAYMATVAGGTYFARTANSAGYEDVLFNGIDCVAGCNVTTGTPISTTTSSTANFQLLDNTPSGFNVTAHPRDPQTGEQRVGVTFPTVTVAGRTTMTVPATLPPLPPGYQLSNPARYFDLATTATHDQPVGVCVSYAGLSFVNPAQARLLSFENGAWVDVTAGIVPPQTVCGTTAQPSRFALTERLQIAPVLTWPQPADILVGTPLGPAQLNASANVPGTFVYSPPAGAVLFGVGIVLSATFTPADTVTYSSGSITTTLNVVKITPVITWPTPADISEGTPLGLSQLNATTGVPGTFVYTPGAGAILPPGNAHPLMVTFTPSHPGYYEATATVFINVTPNTGPRLTIEQPVIHASQVIRGAGFAPNAFCQLVVGGVDFGGFPVSPTGSFGYNFPYNEPAAGFPQATTFTCDGVIHSGTQLQATGVVAMSPSGTLTFEAPAFTGSANIWAQGLPPSTCPFILSAVGVGVNLGLGAAALFPDGTFGYNFAFPNGADTAAQYILTPQVAGCFEPLGGLNPGGPYPRTINLRPIPTITWVPGAINAGTPLGSAHLNATANMPGTFVYTPPAGTVLTAGFRMLSVTFTPDNPTYLPVTLTRSILVQNSVVTWSSPANIVVGTPLSGTQLNATASVPGTFVYSPPAGTVLPVGNAQTLSVTFTPASPVSPPVTRTVTINVVATGGRFSGTVTDAVTGAPLQNATVTAHDLNGNQVAAAVTDAAGQYVTPDVAGGQYYTRAQTSGGYLAEVFNGITCVAGCDVRIGTRVSVPIDNTMAGINFSLSPLASITGTIRNTGNQPISGIAVSVFNGSGTLVKTVTSGPSGEYAATGLATGSYFARTTNTAGYADVLYDGIDCITGCDVTTGTPISTTLGTVGTANFVLPANTPPGTDVVAQPVDTETGEQNVSITFSAVTAPGLTTVTTSESAPPLPSGYQTGNPAKYFDLSTTATFVPPLTVCVSYAGISFDDPNLVRLLHYDAGSWVDVTTSVDTTAQVVCGLTQHLSPFALVEQLQTTPSLSWATPANITYGTLLGPSQLNATASVPGTFTYSPAAGTMLAAGVHTLSVTFTPTDVTRYTTATASVSLTVMASGQRIAPTVSFTGAPDSALAGSSFTVVATTNASTTAVITATGSCTVSGVTVTMTSGVGACHLTAEWAADDTYRAATRRQSTKADKRTPVITWTAPAPIVYGTALDATQLNATADVPGTFVYTPAAGRVLAGGTHTLKARFTPADTDNYSRADATVTLVVTPAAAVLTWDPPAAIVYGDDLGPKQLKAKASVGGTFVYSPPAGTVLPAGVHTLSVTFTPNNAGNYTGATTSVTLTVTKATPKITWQKPAPIVAGTPLGAEQLDATANVPGSFVYAPPAGTLLPAGNQQLLSVTFTPTDSANYALATDSVTINVKRR